jgi:putative tryptophan/tyrosine transport system substrate-binding protein
MVTLAGLILGLAILVAPLAAEAQPPGKISRIGLLVIGPSPDEHACVRALRRGFVDLGYMEGRTHVVEIRWAEGQPEEKLPRLGAELVRLGVDLIVSVTAQGLVDAKRAIAAVPVVMAAASFPVERGFMASLSRPGGNITGMATFTGEMFAKTDPASG